MLSSDLFTKALAVLAFLTAFYALVARERKTPYITNTLYSTLYFILLSLFASLLSALFPTHPRASLWLSRSATVLFIACLVLISFRLWKLQNRQFYLRDDNLIRNTLVVRKAKSLWRSIRRVQTYEHHPLVYSPQLIGALSHVRQLNQSLVQKAIARTLNGRFSPSIYAEAPRLADADLFLVDLAKAFLQSECNVQYSTCARHPLELLLQLQAGYGANGDWRAAARRLVVVDAYSPHFGFTDSNFIEATKSLREMGVESVAASQTYAGLHGAAARAFNVIKKRDHGKLRAPTLVIYEGAFALTDLESIEQYRLFMRHVLASERMWGGMLTTVIEGTLPVDVRHVLTSYVDIDITLSSQDV